MTRLARILTVTGLAVGAYAGTTVPAQATDYCRIAPWMCYVCVTEPCYPPPFEPLCGVVITCGEFNCVQEPCGWGGGGGGGGTVK